MAVVMVRSALVMPMPLMAHLAEVGRVLGTIPLVGMAWQFMATKTIWVSMVALQLIRTNRRAAVARVAQDYLA